jgi:DNA-binding LacI/PurR family transcriptional regulator
MTHRRYRPLFGVQKAITFVETLMQQRVEAGLTRLPTVKTMSQTIGVSSVTLCKALAILRNRGDIRLSQRNGIHVQSASVNSDFELRKNSAAKYETEHTRLRQPLALRILHDLYAGELLSDEILPSMKQLSAHYGACHTTLTRALEELVDGRILRRYKKSYRLAIVSARKNLSRIVLVSKADSLRSLEHLTPQSAEFWRLMERDCARKGLTVAIWSYRNLESNLQISQMQNRSSGRTDDTLGFVIMTQNASRDELQHAVAAVAPFRIPVALVDESGLVPIPSLVSTSPFMRLFVVSASTAPGRMVGSYLLRRGHRRISYFTAFSKLSWSINRWRGINECFSEAGIDGGAKLWGVDGLHEYTSMYQPGPGVEPFSSIRPFLKKVQTQIDPGFSQDLDDLYYLIISQLWTTKFRMLLAPLFEAALADRTVTAWVLESDSAAMMALDFLESRSIRVPDELSVVGFDNSIGSLGSGLTTYDFNIPGLVAAITSHLLPSNTRMRRLNTGPMEIPGIIIERRTSRAR